MFLACLEAFSTHAWEIWWFSTKPKSSRNHRFQCPSHWWRCSTRFRCLQMQADVTTGRVFFQPPAKKGCNLPDLIVFFWNSMVRQCSEKIILFLCRFFERISWYCWISMDINHLEVPQSNRHAVSISPALSIHSVMMKLPSASWQHHGAVGDMTWEWCDVCSPSVRLKFLLATASVFTSSLRLWKNQQPNLKQW